MGGEITNFVFVSSRVVQQRILMKSVPLFGLPPIISSDFFTFSFVFDFFKPHMPLQRICGTDKID